MTVEPWIAVSSAGNADKADGRDDGARFQPAFLDGFERGRRFAVWWLPMNTPGRGTVLCIPSPTDGILAARRVISAQAWRLARRGWVVFVPDLYGCGDSAGESSEATLGIWRRDLLRHALLARQRAPGPTVLWSMAAGSLLAVDLAYALDQLLDAIVLWQPCADGQSVADSLSGCARYSPQLVDALSGLPMQPPPIAEGGRQPVIGFLEVEPERAVKQEHPATDTADSKGSIEALGNIAPTTRNLLKEWLDAGHLVTARTVPFRVPAPGDEEATAENEVRTGRILPEALFDATVNFLDPLR